MESKGRVRKFLYIYLIIKLKNEMTFFILANKIHSFSLFTDHGVAVFTRSNIRIERIVAYQAYLRKIWF